MVQFMTHSELAKSLKLSRSTISRDVAKGMPLDIAGAKRWREEFKDIRGEKTGPKTIEHYDEPEQRLPKFLLREIEEVRLAKRIAPMHASDGEKLVALRQEYDKVACLVQADYLDRLDCALTRRMLSTYGGPGDCFESFVEALAELVEKWQEALHAGDEEPVEVRECLN